MAARKFTVEEIAACYNRNGGNAKDTALQLGITAKTVSRNIKIAKEKGIKIVKGRTVVFNMGRSNNGGKIFLSAEELSKIGVTMENNSVSVTVKNNCIELKKG